MGTAVQYGVHVLCADMHAYFHMLHVTQPSVQLCVVECSAKCVLLFCCYDFICLGAFFLIIFFLFSFFFQAR
jgi:hypothetical protein